MLYTKEKFEEQRNSLWNDVAYVLEQKDIPYASFYVYNFLDRWYDAKAPLLELLSRHPNWDETSLSVMGKQEFSRAADLYLAQGFYNDICRWIYNNYDAQFEFIKLLIDEGKELSAEQNALWTAINNLDDAYGFFSVLREIYDKKSYSGTVDEEVLDLMKSYKMYDGNASSGKLTRLLRKFIFQYQDFFEDWKTEGGASGLESRFAKLSDCLNPILVKHTACLSLHPCDYLLMSNGTGWRSCHAIPDGEYSAGDISYANDGTSMVFYTLPDDFKLGNGEPWWQHKIERQLFFYDKGRLHQSRLYPNDSDARSNNQFRNIVQMIMSTVCGVANSWKLITGSEARKYMSSGEGACQYPDYYYTYADLATTSLLKPLDPKDYEESVIVAGPKCGSTISFEGDELPEESNITGPGFYCEVCDEWHHGEPAGHIEFMGDFCQDCLDSGRVVMCEHCDNYVMADEITTVHVGSYDEDWCEECAGRHATQCDCCGEWFDDNYENFVCVEGRYYCESCTEEELTCCEDCGEYIKNCDVIEMDGDEICSACADARVEEEAE